MALTIDTASKSGQIKPGAIRTATPFVVGMIGSWLTRRGLNVNDDFLAALLVPAYGYAYYLVARFLEVYVSPKWKYILGLGIATAPATYVTAPAVITTEEGAAVVTEDEPIAPLEPPVEKTAAPTLKPPRQRPPRKSAP